VGAGSLENEVVFEYDDFGNLAKDLQSHAGAVGGSTPSVSYAHEDGFYNNTRLTAMTFPNGRVVQMGYGTTGGRDDLLSRIASVKIQGESQYAVTYRFAGAKHRS